MSLLLRSAFFFVSPYVPLTSSSVVPTATLVYILANHILELVFFMAFFSLVLFWAETYESLSRGYQYAHESSLPRGIRLFFLVFIGVCVVRCGACSSLPYECGRSRPFSLRVVQAIWWSVVWCLWS